MKIEATGHGVISLSMDIEEAKTLLETGSLPSLRMIFPSALSAELERAILREDEMQQDMEAQSAEEKRVMRGRALDETIERSRLADYAAKGYVR